MSARHAEHEVAGEIGREALLHSAEGSTEAAGDDVVSVLEEPGKVGGREGSAGVPMLEVRGPRLLQYVRADSDRAEDDRVKPGPGEEGDRGAAEGVGAPRPALTGCSVS